MSALPSLERLQAIALAYDSLSVGPTYSDAIASYLTFVGEVIRPA